MARKKIAKVRSREDGKLTYELSDALKDRSFMRANHLFTFEGVKSGADRFRAAGNALIEQEVVDPPDQKRIPKAGAWVLVIRWPHHVAGMERCRVDSERSLRKRRCDDVVKEVAQSGNLREEGASPGGALATRVIDGEFDATREEWQRAQ